jgi:hypothetical protein
MTNVPARAALTATPQKRIGSRGSAPRLPMDVPGRRSAQPTGLRVKLLTPPDMVKICWMRLLLITQ